MTGALPSERPGRPAPPSLVERRAKMAAALAAGHWRTSAEPVAAWLGGVRCIRFPAPENSRGVVIHFHGGGYRQGCPEMTGPFAEALAKRCQVDVICPAYRLAPEHPFPAALHDALAVVRALDAARRPLILSGDSAGGGIAAALATLVPADGLILLSAWLDLRLTSSAYERNAASDQLVRRDNAEEGAHFYLQGHAPDDPLASPVFADPAHFPRTLLSVGAGELFVDDSVALHTRLQDAGVEASLYVIPGMEHIAVVRGFGKTGAAETFDAVARFVDQMIEGD